MCSFVQVENNALSSGFEKFNRDLKSFQEDVKTLQEWMKTQRHLPEIMDEKLLQNFLLLNKCSLEKCKKKIDNYYTIRYNLTDFFQSMNPKCANMQQFMAVGRIVLVPKMSKDFHRVLIMKISDKSLVNRFDPVDFARQVGNLNEIRLKEDIMLGDVIIFDMDGINFDVVTRATPSSLLQMLTLYEKILSIPLKGLYFVNSPSFVSTVITILKTVMKPKLFDRIFVCKNTLILKEKFEPECLPKDYGGDAPSTEELFEVTKLYLKKYQNRFDELDSFIVDENLRPERLEDSEILGFYGNFKKLNVD